MKTKIKNKSKIMKLLSVSLVAVLCMSTLVGFANPAETCFACTDCDDCVSDMALDGDDMPVAQIACDESCGCGGTDYTLYGCDSICECGTAVAIIDDGIATISDDSEEDTLVVGTYTYSYDLGLASYSYDESELTADNEDITTTSYSPSISGDADVTISASVQYPESADGDEGLVQIYYLGPDESTFAAYLDDPEQVIAEIDYEETYTYSYTFEDLEAGMHKIIFKFYSDDDDVNAVYTTASTVIVSGTITEMSTISDVSMTSGTDTDVSFTFTTNGDLGDLSYVWYLNNTAYETTEDPEITLNTLEAGIYTMFCRIKPSVGTAVDTNSFTVTVGSAVGEGGIIIVSQPSDVQVKAGEAATVSISMTAEDGLAIGYEWYINDSAIENSNTSTISFKDLSVGSYDVYCDVSIDGEYSFTTDIATISVIEEDADADTETDADADVDSEEDEETFLTKANNWYDENTTLFWVIIGLGVVVIIYLVKKNK
ncbi:MAG: hypothetical protein R3Y32_06865 [Bacillota bacterium]